MSAFREVERILWFLAAAGTALMVFVVLRLTGWASWRSTDQYALFQRDIGTFFPDVWLGIDWTTAFAFHDLRYRGQGDGPGYEHRAAADVMLLVDHVQETTREIWGWPPPD